MYTCVCCLLYSLALSGSSNPGILYKAGGAGSWEGWRGWQDCNSHHSNKGKREVVVIQPGQPAIWATRHVRGHETGLGSRGARSVCGDCVCDKLLTLATIQWSPGKPVVVRQIQGHGSGIMDQWIRKGFLQPFKIMICGMVGGFFWVSQHFISGIETSLPAAWLNATLLVFSLTVPIFWNTYKLQLMLKSQNVNA